MSDSLTIIALGWLAFAVAALSPGPNMVAVAARSLGAGRAAGQRVAFGIAIGAAFWAVLSAAGLGQLLTRFPGTLRVLSVLGGGYLLWLGVKGLRSAWRGGAGVIVRSSSRGAQDDVLHGLAVTLSNPKVALLWVSLATVVGPAVDTFGLLALFALGSGVLAQAIYGGYGWLFSTRGARGVYGTFSRSADALFGTVFASLGASLIARG